ncbi:heme exporter protein CcmB [Kamptonema cortianum]|nr:heme exporter protein CcmB [Geitlerinema splendidum]MDK3157607.1 heme exporter protein CcmB [Kamptonema cortianum]
MRSAWTNTWICVRKEAICEFRAKHGLLASALFGFMSVVAISIATDTNLLPPAVAAGILGIILIFSGIVSVPRIFLSEDDHGTLDLYRTWVNPGQIVLGKMIFASILQVMTATVLSGLFVVLADLQVTNVTIFLLSVPLLGAGVATCLSLASMFVIGASNRWILVGVISMPLLFPLVFLSVGALRVAFGEGSTSGAYSNLVALLAYTVVPLGVSFLLGETLWGQQRGPVSGVEHVHNEHQE